MGTGNGWHVGDLSHTSHVPDGSRRKAVPGRNGTFLTKWGSAGSLDGQFNQPIGLAVDRSGNVFVADSGNARVQKFTNEGTFVGTVGCSGAVDGGFGFPWGIAIEPASGRLVVSDIASDVTLQRIQAFACP
jgi:DNA-binding beta-propeller fold protein YncE